MDARPSDSVTREWYTGRLRLIPKQSFARNYRDEADLLKVTIGVSPPNALPCCECGGPARGRRLKGPGPGRTGCGLVLWLEPGRRPVSSLLGSARRKTRG